MQAYYVEIEGAPQRITYGTTGEPDELDAFAEMVQGSSDRVVPEQATFDLSSMTFMFSAIPEIVELFLGRQTFAPAFTDAPIDIGDTVISLTEPGFQAGQVLYVGAEAMRVLIAGGGGTYQVVRGEYSTREADHPLGASVWTRIPAWRGRLIKLYSYDDGDTIQRWAGFIESIKTSDDGTRVEVGARNLWTSALNTRVNRATPRARQASAVVHSSDGDPQRPVLRGRVVIEPAFEENFNQTYVRFGDCLVALNVGQELNDGTVLAQFDSIPLLGSRIEQAEEVGVGGRVSGAVRPLFLVSRIADEEWLDSTDYPLAQRVGDLVLIRYPSVLGHALSAFPYHPLAIAAYLLVGLRYYIDPGDDSIYYEYDTGGYWSLFLRDIFTDDFADDILAIMQQDADLEVDHFLLGWEDKEVDVLKEVSQKLLRPFGYFFGVTLAGMPTIKRFRLPSVVDEFLDIDPLPSQWVGQIDQSLETAVEVVSATVGKLPWSDGVSVEVMARDGDANRTRLGDDGKWSLDYSSISDSNVNRVVEDLVRLSVLGSFGQPRFRCRVNDPGDADALGLGDLVRIDTIPVQEPYFVGPDGEVYEGFVNPSTFQQTIAQEWSYGVITERRWNPANWSYDLTVLLTSYRVGLLRLRGPSAVVTAVNSLGGTEFEVEYDLATLGTIGDEFEHAEVGDALSLWNSSFARAADDLTYVSSTSGAVVVDSPTTSIGVGDIIRYSEPMEAYNLLYAADSGDETPYKYG